jgi:hypothetical protein
MNNTEFQRFRSELNSRALNVADEKAKGYARTDDRLHNFKCGGEKFGTHPLTQLLTHADKHYDTLCAYARLLNSGANIGEADGELCGSETIESRIVDLRNYCDLAAAILHEERERFDNADCT